MRCLSKFFLVFSFFLGIVFPISAQIPLSGLKGYWPFHGNAADSSGNGNNGVVHNAKLVKDRFGNCDQAYQFDGVNDNIIVPNSSSINFANTSDFTVAFWIKMHPNNYDGIPLCKNQYGSFSGYQFFVNINNPGYCNSPNHASFYVASGANQDACSNNPIDTNWHFFAGVYNHITNNAVFYLDAVLQTDIGHRTGNINTLTDLYFGSNTVGTNKFKGTLDAIRIYNRMLTQQEIDILYNEPDPGSGIGLDFLRDTAICAGNTVLLYPGSAVSYTWSTGAHSPSILIDSTGKYWVDIVTTDGCLRTDTAHVTVTDKIEKELVTDTTICSDPIVVYINDKNYSVVWWNGSQGDSVIISNAGTYSLEASLNGCKIYDKFVVNNAGISGSDNIVPNVFTPNNDGVNDYFKLVAPLVSIKEIRIYNRWGKLVFQDHQTEFMWDGRGKNGQQDDGTYFWIISYIDNCDKRGEEKEFKGFVTLFR